MNVTFLNLHCRHTGVENTPRPEGGQHDQSTAIAPSNGPSNAPSTGAVLPSSSSASNVATGSTSSSSTTGNNKLDPAVLDALMGKSDGQRMMECVMDLKSEGKYNKEQKLYIWDELELVSSSFFSFISGICHLTRFILSISCISS
jgi:hypothetical protein